MKPQSSTLGKFSSAFLALAVGVMDVAAQSGVFRLSSGSYSVKEAGPAAMITVSRTGGSSGTVTVNFQTVDQANEATSGVDYIPTNGSLTFPQGVTSQSFGVPILQDAVHETNQTILVELTGVEGGTASLGSIYFATITITDDDACGYIVTPSTRTHNAGEAGVFSFNASATEGCPLTPFSNVAWLGVLGVNGEIVDYSLDANSGSTARTGKITVGNKTFTVTQQAPDESIPVVTFSAPAANSRQTNRTITVTGRASDNAAITLVEYRLENTNSPPGEFLPANGLTTWTAVVSNLVPGTNIVRVRAHDSAQLISEEVARRFMFVEVSPLTLSTNGIGIGSISPLKNGQVLDVGREYTISARPGRKYFFSGWTGSLESGANPLTFTMEPDFALQANFALSPFINLSGTYSGLFHEESVTRHESSGFLSARISDVGAFSAKLILGGKRISFSGHLSLDGTTTNVLDRPETGELTIVLGFYDLSGGGDVLTGSVSNANWVASLTAVRAYSSYGLGTAPQAGRYTLLVPGDDDNAATEPGGDSYGSASVDTRGGAKFQLVLADGTTATQKVPIGTNGWCPIYVPLYKTGGSIQGWAAFADLENSDFTGTFAWIKPVFSTAKYYSNGFALSKDFSGARYRPSTNETDRLLPFISGHLKFSGVNLIPAFENAVEVGAGGTVANQGTNRMTFTLSRSTGLFRGTVTPPDADRSMPFKGAIHRGLGIGSGHFFGTDQSGRVELSE